MFVQHNRSTKLIISCRQIVRNAVGGDNSKRSSHNNKRGDGGGDAGVAGRKIKARLRNLRAEVLTLREQVWYREQHLFTTNAWLVGWLHTWK